MQWEQRSMRLLITSVAKAHYWVQTAATGSRSMTLTLPSTRYSEWNY